MPYPNPWGGPPLGFNPMDPNNPTGTPGGQGPQGPRFGQMGNVRPSPMNFSRGPGDITGWQNKASPVTPFGNQTWRPGSMNTMAHFMAQNKGFNPQNYFADQFMNPRYQSMLNGMSPMGGMGGMKSMGGGPMSKFQGMGKPMGPAGSGGKFEGMQPLSPEQVDMLRPMM